MKHVFFVLDMTGSMMWVRGETISGFNEYVQTLKQDAPDAKATVILFNGCKTRRFVDDKKVKKIPAMTEADYVPDCSTPLYDALGAAIRGAEQYDDVPF